MFAPPKKIGSRLRARYVRSAHMFAQKKSDPSNSKKSARASRSLCALRAHVCPPIINRCPLLAPPLFKSWCRHWSTYMYVTIARVHLQQKYFCTHFLCACTVRMIFSVHTCSDDSDPCPGHGNVTCTWQLACEGLYRSPILFNARINATFFFLLWIW